jgi:hypothetical protein
MAIKERVRNAGNGIPQTRTLYELECKPTVRRFGRVFADGGKDRLFVEGVRDWALSDWQPGWKCR